MLWLEEMTSLIWKILWRNGPGRDGHPLNVAGTLRKQETVLVSFGSAWCEGWRVLDGQNRVKHILKKRKAHHFLASTVSPPLKQINFWLWFEFTEFYSKVCIQDKKL